MLELCPPESFRMLGYIFGQASSALPSKPLRDRKVGLLTNLCAGPSHSHCAQNLYRGDRRTALFINNKAMWIYKGLSLSSLLLTLGLDESKLMKSSSADKIRRPKLHGI